MRELRLDDSSNVRRICWRPDDTLEVEFTSGAVYRYSNVQSHQFVAACGADSVGSWVSKTLVKNPVAHPVSKIKSAEDSEDSSKARDLAATMHAQLTANYVKALDDIAKGGDDATELRAIACKALGAKPPKKQR